MRRQRSVAVALGVSVLMLTAACGSSSTTSSSSESASEAGGAGTVAAGSTGAAAEEQCTPDKAGGSAKMGVFYEAAGLDPLGVPGNGVVGGTEITALYDTLIRFDTQSRTYVPQVAESLEPDSQSLVWTMKLKDGIKFGNGDPLTADDVVASIDRHRSDANVNASKGEASTIASMEVVDPLTVKFTLNSPYPDFPHVLATDVGMITNPRVLAAKGPDGFALDPTGGGVGPYEFEKYAPGEEIVLKAKSDYWGGPVCIQELHFVRLNGAQATFEALSNKELDLAFLRESQVIAEARDAGYSDLPTLINYGYGLMMNMVGTHPTKDVDVRLAVAAGIDPEAINQRIYNGDGLPTSALIHPDTPDLYNGQEGPKYDPEAAKASIAKAKAAGWDGKVTLIGENAPTVVDGAIAVKAQLESLGMTVDNQSLPLNDMITRVLVDKDFDIALWGPQIWSEGMWSALAPQVQSTSAINTIGYSNPAVDAALDQLRAASTNEQKQAAIDTLQDEFNKDPWFVNWGAVEETTAYDTRVHGLVLDRGSIIRFDKAYVTES